MDALRARGLISIVGQEVETAPPAAAAPVLSAPAAAAESAPAPAASAATPEAAPESAAPAEEAAPYDRTQDPRWYSEQAADLQAQLEAAQADLAQAQQTLAQASSRVTQPGIDLSQTNLGVTPQAGIEILAARVREIQSQLDDLADLARQNDISPGVLRG